MDHESLFNAFKDMFGKSFETWSYKRLDPHSILIVTPGAEIIFTYYGPTSWKLETK